MRFDEMTFFTEKKGACFGGAFLGAPLLKTLSLFALWSFCRSWSALGYFRKAFLGALTVFVVLLIYKREASFPSHPKGFFWFLSLSLAVFFRFSTGHLGR